MTDTKDIIKQERIADKLLHAVTAYDEKQSTRKGYNMYAEEKMEYPPVCKKHKITKKLNGTQNGYSFWECLKCNEEDKKRLFIIFTKNKQDGQ